MNVAERVANRRNFAAHFVGNRSADRAARLAERTRHQAREQPLPHYRRDTVNGADRFRLTIRQRMQLRLHYLDSAVRPRRDSPADQHALAARKIAAHVSGQVEPHDPDLPAAHLEPSRREPAPPRAAHRPLGNLAEVAFDDDHVPGAQIFSRRALAPVLVARRQMKYKVARCCDSARFQSRRALGTDSRHRGNRALDSKRAATRVGL